MEWTIRATPDNKYPDILTYDILEKNPDAGKSGVVYSGDYLSVCSTDHEPSANLIAASPRMIEALDRVLACVVWDDVKDKPRYELDGDTVRLIKDVCRQARGE